MLNLFSGCHTFLHSLLTVLFLFFSGCTAKQALQDEGLQSLRQPPLPLHAAKMAIHIQREKDCRKDAVVLNPSPAVMVTQWIQDRFYAKGKSGTFVFVIEDASITEETPTLQKTGFLQSEKIVYRANIRLGLYQQKTNEGQGGNAKGGTLCFRVETQQTVSNALNVYERQALCVHLIEKALDRLDTNLTHALLERKPLAIV